MPDELRDEILRAGETVGQRLPFAIRRQSFVVIFTSPSRDTFTSERSVAICASKAWPSLSSSHTSLAKWRANVSE